MDMSMAIEHLIALALQEVLHIGDGKLLLFLRTGLHHGSFPARVVLLHVPAWRIVSCLTCEEGFSLQATSPNAALVLPLYSHCRKRLASLP
jgi:hypothetical protein